MFSVCALVLVLAAAIRAQPQNLADLGEVISNSSSLLGGNAEFYCEVIGTQGVGETLRFVKVDSITGNSDVLTQDSLAIDTTKHTVTERYRLTIKNVAWDDEGEYSCILGVDAPRVAYLVVSDAPTSADLYWPGGKDYTERGIKANMTCEAGLSRPPASFRWFRGQTEVTGIALNPRVTVDVNGYGRGISMLELNPSSNEEGIIYTCNVDVPGANSVVTKTLPIKFSGAGSVIYSSLLIVASVLVATRA